MSGQVAVVAIVTAAGSLPWLVFGLPAGAVADRLDRRSIMWRTDMIRAVIATVFAGLLILGLGNVGLLIAFAFVIGSAQTLFDTAAGALLPEIVGVNQLVSANSRLLSGQMLVGQLIGPALAGFLFAVAVELPFGVDAATFGAAALLVFTLRSAKRDHAGSDQLSMRAEIAAGLSWLNRQPALRAQSGMFFVLSTVSGATLAVFVVYAKHNLGLGSVGYGVMISIFALGGLLGGALGPMARARLDDGRILAACVVAACLSLTVLGAFPHLIPAVLAVMLLGAAAMVWIVITVTVRQEIVPDALMGRVTSTYRMLGFGAVPLGALAAGGIAQAVGLPAMFLIAAGAVLLAAVLCRRGFASVAK
jgi:MFS family permease